jgi:hypothetical protein
MDDFLLASVGWRDNYQHVHVAESFLRSWESLTWLRNSLSLMEPMKMAVFWDVAPCSLVKTDGSFRGAYCLHHCPDDGGSKHLWNIGQFLSDYMCNIPEDSHLHTHCCENLKSHIYYCVHKSVTRPCFESVHTLKSYFLKINFNIILTSMPRFPKWSLPLGFSN